ncbi:MAG: pirin family protein [Steroidobacterales bacterium]
MWELRRSEDRGFADHGWLKSRHSFSFADYYDPRHMGFSVLRVINEDRVAPAKGFGTHGHRDMEILSYVLKGQLAHKDSLGNGSVIVPGDVQRMSAGTGVSHSEMNPSDRDPVHFLQIWILPSVRSIAPSYEQKYFDTAGKRGRLKLVASPDGAAGSVVIHQDAKMYAGLFDGTEHAAFHAIPGHSLYLHLARGSLHVNDTRLDAGDAIKIAETADLDIRDGTDAELLLFDLPGAHAPG